MVVSQVQIGPFLLDLGTTKAGWEASIISQNVNMRHGQKTLRHTLLRCRISGLHRWTSDSTQRLVSKLILVPAYNHPCGRLLKGQVLWGRKWSIFLPHKNRPPRYLSGLHRSTNDSTQRLVSKLNLVPAYNHPCGRVLKGQVLWGRKWSIFLPHKNRPPRYLQQTKNELQTYKITTPKGHNWGRNMMGKHHTCFHTCSVDPPAVISEGRVHGSGQATQAPLAKLILSGHCKASTPLLGVLCKCTFAAPWNWTFSFMLFSDHMDFLPLDEPTHVLCHWWVRPDPHQVMTSGRLIRCRRWSIRIRMIRGDAHRRGLGWHHLRFSFLLNQDRQRCFFSRSRDRFGDAGVLLHKLMPSPGIRRQQTICCKGHRRQLPHQQLNEAGDTPQLHRCWSASMPTCIVDAHRHRSFGFLLAITTTTFWDLHPVSNCLHVCQAHTHGICHGRKTSPQTIVGGSLGLRRVNTTFDQGTTKKFKEAASGHLAIAPKCCRLCNLPEVIRVKLQRRHQEVCIAVGLVLPKATQNLEEAATTKDDFWESPRISRSTALLSGFSLGAMHFSPGSMALHKPGPL